MDANFGGLYTMEINEGKADVAKTDGKEAWICMRMGHFHVATGEIDELFIGAGGKG